MTPARPTLDLYPERCDECGRCVRVCPENAIKAKRAYVFVDWERCDGCGECVEACDREAIAAKGAGGVRPARDRALAERPASDLPPRTPPAFALDPTRDAASPVRWSLAEAAAVLAAMLALFVVEEVVLGSTWVAELKPGAAAVARMAVLGAYYGAQLAVLAVLVRRRGGTLARGFALTGAHTRAGHKAASAAVGGLALAAALASTWAWGKLATAAGWAQPQRWNSDVTALFGGDVAGLALTLALAAALGPFVEELAFRGVVQDAIGRRWGTAAGVLCSAAVFGVFHFSAWQFVPAALLGATLAWVTARRGSLWPAIAVHSSYNGIAVLAAFWLQSHGGA